MHKKSILFTYKRHKKPFNQHYQKLPSKFHKKRKGERKTNIICYKCGKPGHKANKCGLRGKINELFGSDEELKE